MSSTLVTLMRNTLTKLVESNRFDRVLKEVQIVSASKGCLVAEMPVSEQSLNWSDALHGGMTATLVDQLSSLALTTAVVDVDEHNIDPSFAKVRSVSIDLNISYVNGIRSGETLVIQSNVLKSGKNIAFLSVDMTNKRNNQLVATARHTKYLLS